MLSINQSTQTFSGVVFLIISIVLLMTAGFSSLLFAANQNEGLKTEMERLWIDYANGLKSVMAEKDDNSCAKMLDGLRTNLVPRYQQVYQKYRRRQQDHVTAEQRKFEEWTQQNAHYRELDSLMFDPEFLKRTSKSKALGRSFADFNRALATAARSAR